MLIFVITLNHILFCINWVNMDARGMHKLYFLQRPCQIHGAPPLFDVFKGLKCVSARKFEFFKNKKSPGILNDPTLKRRYITK